jgi:LysM repeat protein
MAIVLTALLIITGLPGILLARGSTESDPPVQAVISVQPGDTLWDIAREYTAPGEDIRVTIERIRTHNNLKSLVLHPGQTLEIPTD